VLLNVTETWMQSDGSTVTRTVANNVEVYPVGSPIFAWSGQDFLTGSTGKDAFVLSQPIGPDTIYSFDSHVDQIDLVGFTGFANFDDVQRHLTEDSAGNAVITLAANHSITLYGVSARSLSASNFVFNQTPTLDNPGTMVIGDGAMLPLSGIINNTGVIALNSAGHETHLEIAGPGITLQGGGQIVLSDSSENVLSGAVPGVTMTNMNNTIIGAGQLGAGQMTLINGGSIIAIGTHALVIDTGPNAVINAGTLEATGSGGLIVNSAIANSGLIWAHGGSITIHGTVTGFGTATISGTATLEFGAASSTDVIFSEDSAGTLVIDDPARFTGTISGLSSNDRIDLANISYSSASVYSVTYSSSTNITSLVVTDGTSADTIKLAGNYTIDTSWNFASDGHGGTLVFDPLATSIHQDASVAAELAIEHIQIGMPDNLGLDFDAAIGASQANGPAAFDAAFAHDFKGDFGGVNQPLLQMVADILSRTAEAHSDAVTLADQSHGVTLISPQTDKTPSDFIVHVWHS
jgi:hypothetical protein